MPTQIDLTFVKNQNWFLPLDLSQWALLYDMTQGTYRLHVRSSADAVQIIYGFSSDVTDGVGGTLIYDPTTELLLSLAPYADMKLLPSGSYVYDIQYTPGLLLAPGVPLVQDLVTGTLDVSSGVTRS